jgi:methyltransferase (TIGR00027 family)
MTPDAASRTALMMAAFRANASARPKPVCVDEWAGRLAGDDGHALATSYERTYPHMELWTALRVAYFDRCVTHFATSARPQVVMLGAGLDTRAARLAKAGVRFFEVDHPESQKLKLSKLGELEHYPVDAATYVACDFEKTDFLTALCERGFRDDTPALFVWEGVTVYLTEAAVRATAHRVASACAPETILGFDHLRKKIVHGELRHAKDVESRTFVANMGEPLRFGVDDALPLLYEEGFRRVRTRTFDEVCLELTGTYERERAFAFQRLVLASVAAPDLESVP